MKWDRITVVSRVICFLLGVGAGFATWFLYSASQTSAEQVPSGFFILGGLGALQFLFAAIVGRFPSLSQVKVRSDRE